MKIMLIDVLDGLRPIKVCIADCDYSDEEARLRKFIKDAQQSLLHPSEHYQRGYDDAMTQVNCIGSLK